MFLRDYNLNVTITDTKDNKYQHNAQHCFKCFRDYDRDILSVKVELVPDQSRYTTNINTHNFQFLQNWFGVGATVMNGKTFLLDDGIKPANYYFNLCVYFRLAFEVPYMPVPFVYRAVFGDEFDQHKLLLTQTFMTYVGSRAGNHAITNGDVYLEPKMGVEELKERFETHGVYNSWQKQEGKVFNFYNAYRKHRTLIGVYNEFDESLHSKQRVESI